MKSTLETSSSAGTLNTASRYAGLVLGVLAGLEIAGAAETVLGKVAAIVGLTWFGGWVGNQVGKGVTA